ncbi:hypothetical protein C6501_14825 [Candidatus Poribacteria bacterium]|nr:MAG: hypothetical protein C6501_14825 [Candidatus Poribacteria bacterium]
MKYKVLFGIMILLGVIGGVRYFFNRTHLPPELEMSIQKSEDTSEPFVENKRFQKYSSKTVFNPFQQYNGPQTVEALLKTYSTIAADPEIDATYPQREWLQMLLKRGIVIENFNDYSGYMAARRALVHLKNDPEIWTSDVFGIPPTNDWETFKDAFIERKIWEYEQLRAAVKEDPDVSGGLFAGTDKRIFLPTKIGRVYVKRKKLGAVFFGESLDANQINALLYEGIHPKGYEVIYIDDNGKHLTEIPPPITLQDLLGNTELFSQKDTISVEAVHSEETLQTQAQPIERQQDELYEYMLSSDDKSNEHIEFEKTLTKKFSKDEQVYQISDVDMEVYLREQFSSTRFNSAMETLNRYGLEEGLHKLFDEDSELALELERYILNRKPSQKEVPK